MKMKREDKLPKRVVIASQSAYKDICEWFPQDKQQKRNFDIFFFLIRAYITLHSFISSNELKKKKRAVMTCGCLEKTMQFKRKIIFSSFVYFLGTAARTVATCCFRRQSLPSPHNRNTRTDQSQEYNTGKKETTAQRRGTDTQRRCRTDRVGDIYISRTW